MADYRIGDLKFDTEEEYRAAKADLERIKDIMSSFDTKSKDGAKAALDSLSGEPGFESDYGRKFIEKLQRTAGTDMTSQVEGKDKSSQVKNEGKEKTAPGNNKGTDKSALRKNKGTGKAASGNNKGTDKNGRVKSRQTDKGTKKSGSSVHIITNRNIIIGAVAVLIIAAVVLIVRFSGLGKNEESKSKNEMRNLVMAYAADQVELKSELYNYFLNVQGEDEARAAALAESTISDVYAMDVSVLDLEKMSDEYIGNIYTVLVNAGEIENGAFNEPDSVTELKKKIQIAKAAGSGENSARAGDSDITYDEPANTEDSLKVNLLNQLMDYQQRIASALNYEYSHFGMDSTEVSEYVIEDMEHMFDKVLYDMTLSEEEKIMYFDTLAARGFFAGGNLVRFSSDPAVYELPDLTPSVNLVTGGEKIRLTCIQESVAPVYSVAYRLTDGVDEGYLMFRSNENMSVVLNDDSGNGTFIQGEVLLNWNGKTTIGEWYFNSGNIGFAIGDDLGDGVEYIYEIVY